MQRLLYSIFISFFLILSCAKSKPSGVVSESKITEVLTEVSLLDGYLNSLPSDSAKRVMPVLYDKIFQKYKLDSATFVKNLDFYFGNPNLTDKIYTVVNNNLSKLERDFHVEDSVRNARQQDSMNRINYWQRVYSRRENLRYYNASDTGYKNYYEFNRRAINNSNVEFISNYLNLSPTPNLIMLHKDSLANYMRKYKSPFIYVDTTAQKEIEKQQYKVLSNTFINTLKIYHPLGKFAESAPSRPAMRDSALVEVLPTELQPMEAPIDSVSTLQGEGPNTDQLRQRREMLRSDRMVKPVNRALPQ
ncbi:MAG: DUF4296 domain-containing protein [Sphingobacterium composti]|uniref:DUF4296 domain-containing protein n=1 Tax=Sphingobacterium composti TaxID=363260 RepID=UPI001359EDF1|nr:DUF4296 domain-containing protein [Sphingobacterium composti Ten et al. 2007 non Yoo et al. 2007]